MKMERKEVDGQECRGIKAGPSGPQTAIMPALFPRDHLPITLDRFPSNGEEVHLCLRGKGGRREIRSILFLHFCSSAGARVTLMCAKCLLSRIHDVKYE